MTNLSLVTRLALAVGRGVSLVLLVLGLATSASAQLVADGQTNILDNVTTNVTGDLIIGTNGSFTLLVLTNGAVVTNTGNSYIGLNATAQNNRVIVTGPGSMWTNLILQPLSVGFGGGLGNKLVVTNGGNVASGRGYVGSSASTLITDPSSSWHNNGISMAGNNALLVISNGGSMFSSGSSDIGNSSSDTAIITGLGSLWTNSSNLSIGGSLVVSNGGTVADSSGSIASSSTAFVTGENSLWTNSSNLSIGGTLVVSNGGTVADNSGHSYASVLVTGAGSVWTNRTSLHIDIGGFSTNQLVISNGAKIFTSFCYLSNGITSDYAKDKIIVTDTNSTLQVFNDFYVNGGFGENQLVVSNGGLITASNLSVGVPCTGCGGSNLMTVTRGNVSVTNTLGIYNGTLTFNSGFIHAGALSITGSKAAFLFKGGTLQLDNVYSNGLPFVVGNGVSPASFWLGGGSGSNYFLGGLTISSNATFNAQGTVVGNVSVATGAALVLDAITGKFTVKGSLTLSNGATTSMKIQFGSVNFIKVSSNLTYGGTLLLDTNLIGTLWNGRGITLFSAGHYFGGFSNIVPSTPGAGFRWNTNGLTMDGVLRVASVPTPPPVVNGDSMSFNDTNLTLTITGGNAYNPCYLLSSTNAALPLTNWDIIGTNFFNSSLNARFTNSMSPGEPERYFILQVQ